MTTERGPHWKKLPVIACAVGLALAGTATAQNYPTKPIRLFVSDAGGGVDITMRLVGQAITGPLGQQIVIENRGGGVIAPDAVAHAAPDGYTLLGFGTALWLIQFMRAQVPFNFTNDFAPIALATRSPGVLVTHPSLPVKSVKELIALAKAKPGALNYATASTGTSNHLAAELFKYMAGINATRIPYKGNGALVNALISGEAPFGIPVVESVGQHIRSGRMHALAVTTPQRSVAFPDLPTIAESGLPGYSTQATIGLFAPAKTPAAIITRLNREVSAALARPDIKDRFLKDGVEVGGGTAEQFAAVIEADMRIMGKLIKDVGIRDE